MVDPLPPARPDFPTQRGPLTVEHVCVYLGLTAVDIFYHGNEFYTVHARLGLDYIDYISMFTADMWDNPPAFRLSRNHSA